MRQLHILFKVRGGCWGEKGESLVVENCRSTGVSEPCEFGSLENDEYFWRTIDESCF